MSIVSLTFDDALPEHLDFVAPRLNEHGFHGTFYVHLSSVALTSQANDWKQLASHGHELGNHTIFHPAEGHKDWVSAANAIEDYSLERMEAELRTANDWLQTLDGRTRRSFAYPCSNSVIGRQGLFRRMIRNTRLERTRVATWLDTFPGPGDTRESYRPLAAQIFTACRGGGLTLDSNVPCIRDMDRFMLPSVSIEQHSAEQVTQFLERALKADAWPILQFHGVGGDHGQNCEPAVFDEIIHWLAENHVTVETVTSVANGLD